MAWWQILLIGVVTIVAGVVFGAFFIYLERQLIRRRQRASMAEQRLEDTVPANFDGLFSSSRKRFAGRREKTSVIGDQPKDALPALLEEIESNLQIAAKPWADELLSFQTRIGDLLQDKVNKFPANLQGSLAQIYIDIRLANSIVRLSEEFHRRSPNLDESYMKLCTSITEKINRIKPLMERLRE